MEVLYHILQQCMFQVGWEILSLRDSERSLDELTALGDKQSLMTAYKMKGVSMLCPWLITCTRPVHSLLQCTSSGLSMAVHGCPQEYSEQPPKAMHRICQMMVCSGAIV